MPLLIISSSSFGALPGEKSLRALEQRASARPGSAAGLCPSPPGWDTPDLEGPFCCARGVACIPTGSGQLSWGNRGWGGGVCLWGLFFRDLEGGKGNTPLFAEGHGPISQMWKALAINYSLLYGTRYIVLLHIGVWVFFLHKAFYQFCA